MSRALDRARRELTLALVLCAAGAGLAVFAASRGWVTVAVSHGSPLSPVRESGRVVEPSVPALGVVGLAGVVGLLATRRVGRVLLGVLLAAAGVLIALAALPDLAAPSPTTAAALLDAHGRSVGLRPGGAATAEAHPAWPALAALGGVALAAGGALTVLRGGRWPGMSSRYDAPAATGAAPATGGVAEPHDASSRQLWEALDRGEDPTSAA